MNKENLKNLILKKTNNLEKEKTEKYLTFLRKRNLYTKDLNDLISLVKEMQKTNY